MSGVAGTIPESVNRLVDEYRHRCLWFLRSDYYPETDTQRLQVLEYIERHGDREAFRRAAEIRRWLSRTFQRTICRLLADHRISSGESYVAGGVALNEIMATSRISRDIDLFHDTVEALEASWAADRRRLGAQT